MAVRNRDFSLKQRMISAIPFIGKWLYPRLRERRIELKEEKKQLKEIEQETKDLKNKEDTTGQEEQRLVQKYQNGEIDMGNPSQEAGCNRRRATGRGQGNGTDDRTA